MVFTNVGAQHKDALALEARIKKVVSRCAPATVRIYRSVDSSESMANASGVVLSEDGLVLAAGHVSMPDSIFQIIVSDLKYWDNAVAKLYGIKSVPADLLIGPDGVILAKDLRGEALHKKLAEFLDK